MTNSLAAPAGAAFRVAAVILCALGLDGAAHAEGFNMCGELSNHYGPFDYRKDRGPKLDIVEHNHFTPQVEALIAGINTTKFNIAGDISYTLHTFPNHHRALLSMERLGDERHTDQPPSAKYTIQCYFDRDVRFAPDDTVVRVMYAQYLGKHKQKAEAMAQLEAANGYADADENGFSHYNIGLMYFELGEYDRALEQAHKAMAAGFEKTRLADMLKRENKWQELPGS